MEYYLHRSSGILARALTSVSTMLECNNNAS
jgi:hypothetical protein